VAKLLRKTVAYEKFMPPKAESDLEGVKNARHTRVKEFKRFLCDVINVFCRCFKNGTTPTLCSIKAVERMLELIPQFADQLSYIQRCL
jgi:hypothetical protein